MIRLNVEIGKEVLQVAQFGDGDNPVLSLFHGENGIDNMIWIIERLPGEETIIINPGQSIDELGKRNIIALIFQDAADVLEVMRKLSEVYLSMAGVTPGETIRSQIYNAMSENAAEYMKVAIEQNPNLEPEYVKNLSELDKKRFVFGEWDKDVENKPRDDTGPKPCSYPNCIGSKCKKSL